MIHQKKIININIHKLKVSVCISVPTDSAASCGARSVVATRTASSINSSKIDIVGDTITSTSRRMVDIVDLTPQWSNCR
jgi:hypothetical protein